RQPRGVIRHAKTVDQVSKICEITGVNPWVDEASWRVIRKRSQQEYQRRNQKPEQENVGDAFLLYRSMQEFSNSLIHQSERFRLHCSTLAGGVLSVLARLKGIAIPL